MGRVAIVGSRGFADWLPVYEYVKGLPHGTTVISGGARGVDTWAQQAALARGLTVVVFRPDYDRYPPKVAPLKRNEDIVNGLYRNGGRMVAFWDGTSRGTVHVVNLARAKGIHVQVLRG